MILKKDCEPEPYGLSEITQFLEQYVLPASNLKVAVCD